MAEPKILDMGFLHMMVPTLCPGCGRVGRSPCHECARALGYPPVVAAPGGIDSLVVGFAYRDIGRDVVAAIKYGNDRKLAQWAGRLLAARAQTAGIQVAWVTWVPASTQRRRKHGSDPGQVMARAAARSFGVDSHRVFRRTDTTPQTGRDRSQRLAGPELTVRSRIPLGAVLIVDDVVTTGATLRVAGTGLRAAGVSSVSAAAVAATPD